MAAPTATSFSPFQTHLIFFSTTPRLPAQNPVITLTSGFRRSLALGLNFPLAILTTLTLRLAYGSPLSLYLRPVSIRHVTSKRTMLENVKMHYTRLNSSPSNQGRTGVGQHEVLSCVQMAGLGLADQIHIFGIWAVAAACRGEWENVMSKSHVEMCRSGTLMWDVERRRKFRDGDEGEVLPLRRGGPYS